MKIPRTPTMRQLAKELCDAIDAASTQAPRIEIRPTPRLAMAYRAMRNVLDGCKHKRRVEGPRMPLRWGSAPTEICKDCGCWRSTVGHGRPGAWEPKSTLAKALRADDEL